jgi:hypothetical protein
MTQHPPLPQAVLGSHIAILGKTGSGKTSTAKLAIEQVVADNFRVCVLDTVKSDWWGITSSRYGRHAGVPFKILGGPHGHVPLHASAGKVIGQLVGSGQLPLSFIDMAEFEPGGIQRFFVDFSQALWKSVRGVVYLVIEEAHEVAPKERAGFGAENMAIHWAKKLATGSRTKGIRLLVATQRVQALHNAVLGSCETLIAHRLTLDADQDPVRKWLKNTNKVIADEVAASLASLPTGTGWVCSGEAKIFEKMAFRRIHTYDNTATPERDGAEIAVTTAAVNVDELRGLIGTAVAEAEANDPKLLKAKIAELTNQLAKLSTNTFTARTKQAEEMADAAHADGYARGQRELLGAIEPSMQAIEAAWSRANDAVESSGLALSEFARVLREAREQIGAVQVAQTPRPAFVEKRVAFVEKPAPRVVTVAPRRPWVNAENVNPSVRKILDEVHRAFPLSLSFAAAAARAGISRRSSAYGRYKAAVEVSDEVERADGHDFRSRPGFAAPLAPGADPIATFAARLPPSYANMLTAIASSQHPLTREEIAAAAGVSITSSGFGKGLRQLEVLSLITKDGDAYGLHQNLR